MPWTQVYDPLQSSVLSPLLAAVPVVLLLGLLASGRVSAPRAALAGLASALAIAILFYVPEMPDVAARWDRTLAWAPTMLAAAVHGAAFGLLPIGWIVLAAIFLYAMTVEAGQFEIVKHSVTSLSQDRRIQALLIAFSFGAFVEGAAGFGTPVAISAALMIGAGFKPLYAAGLALLANTSPVAFGALGTPIVTLAKVTGLNEHALSAMVGRQLPPFSLIVPVWLVWVMAGWRGVLGVWPALLVCGGSFAVVQFLVSNFHGPWLVDVAGGLISLAALALFLRVWQPPQIWQFPEEDQDAQAATAPTAIEHRFTDAASDSSKAVDGNSPEEVVIRALAREHGLDYIDLNEVNISPDVIELVPESVARENVILPMSVDDGVLRVILSDPLDSETQEKLRFILNRDVRFALAPRQSIQEAINRHYGQTDAERAGSMLHTRREIVSAWVPWVLLSAFVFLWGLPKTKEVLGVTSLKVSVPALDGAIARDRPVVAERVVEKAAYELQWLATTGTGIFLAAICSAWWLGIAPRRFCRLFLETCHRMRWPLFTIACMLAIAFTTRYSGMDATLGLAFTRTGPVYPLFAALLGWLGVALTGSDTSSNALFGSLQTITAGQLSVPGGPLEHLGPQRASILLASANSSGGVMGKMIDAQSIVVAAAATGQSGQEGPILRFVFLHSLILALLMGLLVLFQAYWWPSIIPAAH